MAALRPVLAMLLLVTVLPVSADAEDVIRLKTGRDLSGRIVEETETSVTIAIPGVTDSFTVERSQIKEIIRGKKAPAGTEPAVPARDGSTTHFLVYGPGPKLRGWHQTRVYTAGRNRNFESLTVFFAAGGEPEVRIHVVETVGPDLVSLGFTYREKVGLATESLRQGEVVSDKLKLTEVRRGETSTRSIPFPKGTLFPSAARLFVLERRAELEGGLETPVFDPRSDAAPFQRLRWTLGERETVEKDGKSIEVLVVRMTRDEVTSEERIGPGDRTVSVELNGPSVVAKAVDAKTLERVKKGENPKDVSAHRLQNTHVDHQSGFSIRKPGANWAFQKGEGKRRITLKQDGGQFAYVDVIRDASIPRGTQLETLALNLQRMLAAESENFVKVSDEYGEMAGDRAYRLIARSRSKGEEIQSLVVAVIHDDVAWIVAGSCPVKYFGKAEGMFERVIAGFEFLK